MAELPRDIVFFSLEPWDEIWRRNQFIVDLLVRRNPALRVLFVAPSANLAKRAGRLANVARPWHAPWPLPGHERVYLVQPERLPLESRPPIRAVNDLLQSWAVARWTRQLGMKGPTLWINDHHRAHLARRARVPVIYDITDDWIEPQPDPRERALIARHDAELCRLADATIVCSERLAQLKRPLVASASRLHLVPNGVHVDHYAAVRDRSLGVPAIAVAWERPVFGYTGTQHAERVDVPLVEAVARRLTAGSLVFVGPNLLDDADRGRLKATGRVHFVPPVPYAEIPDYMRAMDVMMVPHRTSAFVESLNPIKLWEYLAAGKPIVATPVAGFRDFPEHVALAADAESFAAALVEATREPAERCDARVRAVAGHSWQGRVEQIESILRGCQRGATADESATMTPIAGRAGAAS